MEELQLISRQHPGEVVIDNFLEMKDALTQVLARYENVVYTEDRIVPYRTQRKRPHCGCRRNRETASPAFCEPAAAEALSQRRCAASGQRKTPSL